VLCSSQGRLPICAAAGQAARRHTNRRLLLPSLVDQVAASVAKIDEAYFVLEDMHAKVHASGLRSVATAPPASVLLHLLAAGRVNIFGIPNNPRRCVAACTLTLFVPSCSRARR
jgi:hypothetical protein